MRNSTCIRGQPICMGHLVHARHRAGLCHKERNETKGPHSQGANGLRGQWATAEMAFIVMRCLGNRMLKRRKKCHCGNLGEFTHDIWSLSNVRGAGSTRPAVNPHGSPWLDEGPPLQQGPAPIRRGPHRALLPRPVQGTCVPMAGI